MIAIRRAVAAPHRHLLLIVSSGLVHRQFTGDHTVSLTANVIVCIFTLLESGQQVINSLYQYRFAGRYRIEVTEPVVAGGIHFKRQQTVCSEKCLPCRVTTGRTKHQMLNEMGDTRAVYRRGRHHKHRTEVFCGLLKADHIESVRQLLLVRHDSYISVMGILTLGSRYTNSRLGDSEFFTAWAIKPWSGDLLQTGSVLYMSPVSM